MAAVLIMKLPSKRQSFLLACQLGSALVDVMTVVCAPSGIPDTISLREGPPTPGPVTEPCQCFPRVASAVFPQESFHTGMVAHSHSLSTQEIEAKDHESRASLGLQSQTLSENKRKQRVL